MNGFLVPDTWFMCFPISLNMACFIMATTGWGPAVGYDPFLWPPRSSGAATEDDDVIREAWKAWWNELVEQRFRLIISGKKDYDDTILDNLDPPRALRTIVNRTASQFQGWWSEPYIGGHRALFNAVEPRKAYIYQALERLQPGTWHIDILAPRQGLSQVVFQSGQGWALLHPQDVWNLDWIVPTVVQQEPNRIAPHS